VTGTTSNNSSRESIAAGRRWSRRTFLGASAAAGGALALAGHATRNVAAQSAAGDLQTAMLAASLEVLAVNTYQAALAAMSQHQYALDQWNSVITGAGYPAVNTPPADLNATVQQMFGQVSDLTGAAKLALLLEQVAADTYFVAIPTLASTAAISLAGNFEIIDRQHQSILLFVLGQYPVPQTFVQGDHAYQGTVSSGPGAYQGPAAGGP
jgi:hypothetical protein